MKMIKTRGYMPVFEMQLITGAEKIKNELMSIFDITMAEIQEITSHIGGDNVLFGLVEIDKKPFGLFYLDLNKRDLYDTGIYFQVFSQYFTILKGQIIPHLLARGLEVDEDNEQELEYQAWEMIMEHVGQTLSKTGDNKAKEL